MPKNSFPSIFAKSSKPTLFETGETHFWGDPHISKSMLEAHLDQAYDGASRKIVELKKLSATWSTQASLKQVIGCFEYKETFDAALQVYGELCISR